MIKYARLPIYIHTAGLQTDAQQMLAAYTGKPHYNVTQYHGEWNVITLRSPGGNADNIAADLIGANAFADTPLMLQMPAVQQIISMLHCETMAVRLLNLKAGARIMPHRDNDLSFEHGEARLHIPVFTNAQVAFFIEEERVIMQPGECWYINANLTHHVFNGGETDRVHLVIDCKVNDWLKDVFQRGEITTKQPQQDIEETKKIIAELRRMNTETTNKLADNLQKTIQA